MFYVEYSTKAKRTLQKNVRWYSGSIKVFAFIIFSVPLVNLLIQILDIQICDVCYGRVLQSKNFDGSHSLS